MKHCRFALLAIPLIAWSLAGNQAAATVFGLKSCGSGGPDCGIANVVGGGSLPPTRLFSMLADGTGFSDHGNVTVGGTAVDADGLAMRSDGGLFAFELTENVTGTSPTKTSDVTASRLISLGSGSPVATVIGSNLERDIRGAVFDGANHLWAIDALHDVVLQINAASGAEVAGTVRSLSLGSSPFALGTASDIAIRADGTVVLSDREKFFELDLATGILTSLFSHTGDAYAGLAFDPASSTSLLAYEVNGTEDIFAFDTGLLSPPRTDVLLDIIPVSGGGFNAGRGDLASITQVVSSAPEPATLALLALGLVGVGFRRRQIH